MAGLDRKSGQGADVGTFKSFRFANQRQLGRISWSYGLPARLWTRPDPLKPSNGLRRTARCPRPSAGRIAWSGSPVSCARKLRLTQRTNV